MKKEYLINKKIALSQRTKKQASPIRKIFSQLPSLNSERIHSGLDGIIDLTIGQPHLPVNSFAIKEVCTTLMKEDILTKFGYSAVRGRPETITAIINLYKQYYPEVCFSDEEIICTNGANQALWNSLSILIDGEKDAVLLFEPYFGHYESQIAALGGECIKISTYNNHFKPTADKLIKALKQHPNAKALILNFPNNPAGINLEQEEFIKIINVLRENPQIAIISDEVYRELNFSSDYQSIINVAPDLKDRTILINSGSKGLLGAPDIRIGMAAGPKKWIQAMGHQQMLTTASVSYFSQIALVSGVKNYLELSSVVWKENALQEYKKNIAYMSESMQNLGFLINNNPTAGFYLLVNAGFLIGYLIPDKFLFKGENEKPILIENINEKIGGNILKNDINIAAFLLHVSGIAVVPGSSFGIDSHHGFLRVSCAANDEKLKTSIKRLENTLDALLKTSKKSFFQRSDISYTPQLPVKNIAIIGVGNVGEWLLNAILTEVYFDKIKKIGNIYLMGRSKEKLRSKFDDQIHGFIIDSCYERANSKNIDLLSRKIIFTEDYSVLKDVSYVITAFGAPMDKEIKQRSDLLFKNNEIAFNIAEKLRNFCNKEALIVNIANPLDVITWQLQEYSGFPTDQVIGVSGILDTARLAQAIQHTLNIKYEDIDLNSLVVLGQHGPAMVPLLSNVKVLNKPLLKIATEEQIDKIIFFTKHKGTEMMENFGKIPPHVGTAKAIITILSALFNNRAAMLPCSVWNEEYQSFIGTLVRISNKISIKPSDLNVKEKIAMTESANEIKRDKETISHFKMKDDWLVSPIFGHLKLSKL